MNIIDHYLDLSTGEELPVVTCKVYAEEDGVLMVGLQGTSQAVVIDQESFDLEVKRVGQDKAIDYPVAIRFVANPEFVRSSRQKLPRTVSIPRVVPEVVAIGRHTTYPCTMIRVKRRTE